ncbi:STAS/SEC14 domain-containing protein [Sulfurimonas sp.]
MKKHGITLGFERVDGEVFMIFNAYGILTHEDYELITPMMENALLSVKKESVRALFNISEIEGWEARAAWDDFKLGLKHGSEFKKIALYGNKTWQEVISKIGAWFVSGELQYFENYDEALAWCKS